MISQFLKNFISVIQSSKIVGVCLLSANAILFSLFTESYSKIDSEEKYSKTDPEQNRLKNQNKKIGCHIFLCIFSFFCFFLIILFIIYIMFCFLRLRKNFRKLLGRILKFYGVSFLLPLGASIIASFLLHIIIENGKKTAYKVSKILLAIVIVLFSVQFVFSSLRLVQRPHIQVPIEAVSFLIHSNMGVYPFALSSDILEDIGDGHDLLIDEKTDGNYEQVPVDLSSLDLIVEPTNLSGYINDVLAESYAYGMTAEDYLRKAYDLFLAGRYTNNDMDTIAHMWHLMYNYEIYLPELSFVDYLYNALEYYQRATETFGENSTRYCNMAFVYDCLKDFANTRNYFNRALELNANADEHSQSVLTYKNWVRNVTGMEPSTLLMEDAQSILNYDPQDLSMIILYSACALNENINIERAYQLLCEADDFFQGKSAMVKILRCICADQTGIDESFLLKDIYALEEENGLNGAEETYLIRYLFMTNRNEELWGYIVDVKSNNDDILSIERILMKAEWYFKIADTEAFIPKEAEDFLAQIQEHLSHLEDGTKEKELLHLAKILLQSSLGEIESIEEYEPKGIFYVEYALAAMAEFNSGRYEEAISYCGEFFMAERGQGKTVVNLDRENLSEYSQEEIERYSMQPQEAVNLHYYVQLIYAYSCFEYAKELPKNSEDRAKHMELAEQVCIDFKQSSKSFYYIGDLFQTLKNSIDIENGNLPEAEEANVEVS